MFPAITFSFDDFLDSQRDNAIPLLNDYGYHGTFFVIQNSPYGKFDKSALLSAVANGHEVGSHSVNHRKAGELDLLNSRFEADESKKFLENELGIGVVSYAYPFTDAWKNVQDAAKRSYKQARGGRVARHEKIIEYGDGVNLYDVPAYHVGASTLEHLPMYFDSVIQRKGWLVLMFHGVGKQGDWDNIETKDFEEILKEIKKRNLNVLTFAEGAEEYRRKL